MKTRRRDLLCMLGTGMVLALSAAALRRLFSGKSDRIRADSSISHHLAWPVRIPEKSFPRDIGPGVDLAG